MTDKITVVHSDGSTEIFRPRLIGQAIMKETGVNEDLAIKIQKRITTKFYKLRDDGLKLKEYVKSIGQENNIIFVGYIDDSYLPIFYNCSKAFIYPSFYEGFGLPPLEAMSCKCPVITSNISSIPEVTLNNALLFDPSNIDDLSSSMLTLLNNDSLQEEYSERGFKRSLEFSWKKTSDLTLENYKKIKAL